jgi:hypothetical protein
MTGRSILGTVEKEARRGNIAPAFRFSGEILLSSECPPPASESIGYRRALEKRMMARPSLLFRSAIASIDAAVGLLALGQVSQSFLLLTQAAEVSLKAALDEINHLGLAAWAAHNPVLFRNRSGDALPFDESRLRESVTGKHFLQVFREVSAFIEFSEAVNSSCDQINRTRNEIAHGGGDPQRARFYLDQMIFKVLPLLDEFYLELMGVGLCDIILHDVARELIVAGRFLRARNGDREGWRMALRPVAAAYFHRRTIDHGAPLESNGLRSGRDLTREHDWERRIAGSLKGNVLEQETTLCHICGERCYLSTDGVLKSCDGVPYFRVSAMACTYCNLRIPEEYSDLAMIHYGRVDEHLLGRDNWRRLVRDFGLDPDTLQES